MTKSRSQGRDGSKAASRKRSQLNRIRILAAALKLIERDGPSDFSTRRLGAALGVEAMSLYHHFPSKEALLDALAEHLLQQLTLPPTETADWRGWMRQVAGDYRRLAFRYPQTFALAMFRRFRAPGALAFMEANLKVLTAAGFDLRGSVRLTRTIGGFVNGITLAEIARSKGARAAPAVDALPLVRRAEPFLRDAAMDGAFDFGLALILDAAVPSKPIRDSAKTNRP